MVPRASDVRKVAERFRGLLEKCGDSIVDGRSLTAHVQNGQACGCHAGMYALAKMVDRLSGEWDFSEGAKMMEEDLGFRSTEEGVLYWAGTNPEIWGNDYGANMFSMVCETSFDQTWPNLRLSHVVEWWDRVATRMEEKEDASEA